MSNFSSDLSASVCAVQLAGRTESRLYALQCNRQGRWADSFPDEPAIKVTASEQLDSFRFVAEFGGVEGVPVTFHILAEATEQQVAGFLIANGITCLVVGGWPRDLRAAQEDWLGGLRVQCRVASRRFCADLQVIVAPLLKKRDLMRILAQSLRLSRIAEGENKNEERRGMADGGGFQEYPDGPPAGNDDR
ncbi:MAG: hypothetical protein HY885_04710 [Deltaproteobacteria bacterium]|nr:hypothetical protein [Deltaproteobacteria bacterium]